MAIPKIFVSSTCYDLKEIRDNLYEFIKSIGFSPVFSDKNDVFYHPDLHTHDACIKEIESCQLFILIIGGRFGGNYKSDKKKSIVNAEYLTAKELNIPMITFVKKDVNSNHLTYQMNKKNEIENKIQYPAISKQDDAPNIFEFINDVRLSDLNNAIFEFEFTRDITEIIKKQYAGMFYDFLWERKNNQEQKKTTQLLSNLTEISEKTEEIIKNIYKSVEPEKSKPVLENLENEVSAKRFWLALFHQLHFGLKNRTDEELKKFVEIKANDKWSNYLIRAVDIIKVKSIVNDKMEKITIIENTMSKKYFAIEWPSSKEMINNKKILKILEKGFDSFKELSFENRIKIVSELTYM